MPLELKNKILASWILNTSINCKVKQMQQKIDKFGDMLSSIKRNQFITIEKLRDEISFEKVNHSSD